MRLSKPLLIKRRMKTFVERHFQESMRVKEKTLRTSLETIVLAAETMGEVFKAKKKVFLFGNGGSAADSQHIAAELVGRFQKERRALPAIALTTDTSALTALGNDYAFEMIFSRQLEALAQQGDMAIGISTSGNSSNVIAAIKQAKKMGLTTMTLTGHRGGKLAKLSDICIIVPSTNTAHIQESHICIAHTLCALVEEMMFSQR